MKKLSLYIFLCLLLKGCGEPATKIYPKNGMFMVKNKTYDLSCFIEFGRSETSVDYHLKFNAKTEFVEFIQEDWQPFRNIKIVENTPGAFIFTIGDDTKNMYQLFPKRGDFGLRIGDSGGCVEKGYGWVLNKDNNTIVYKKLN
jgi:hypothetical protein